MDKSSRNSSSSAQAAKRKREIWIASAKAYRQGFLDGSASSYTKRQRPLFLRTHKALRNLASSEYSLRSRKRGMSFNTLNLSQKMVF